MGWQDDPVIDEEIGTVAGAVSNNPAWMNDPVIEDIQEKTPSGIMALPSDINEESQKLVDVWNADQNPISKIWQTLGIAGETAGKVVGRTLETAKPVTDALLEGARFAGSDRRTIDKRLQEAPKVTSIGQEIAKTETVQDLSNTYKIFKQDNPELAANLEAGLKVLEGMTVGKVGGKGGAVAKDVAKDVAGAVPEIATKAADKLDKIIDEGVSKGIKPTVVGKPSLARMEGFYDNAKQAVKTIAENRSDIKIIDDAGEVVAHPRTSAEFAQAIDQAKKKIYKQYHDMSVKAGDGGASFDLSTVKSELNKISSSDNLKMNPKVREYAASLADELEELDGAAPDVVEARIADLNNSLAGFYDGRVTKAQAQVDASVANLMRKELDDKITNAVGEGYQDLKNKYGSLKAIEKEVNKRALVNARQNAKGLTDLTDIFTGGEIVSGILSMNPALIAKGVAGRGIKEIYKNINKPDRYIERMFQRAYRDVPESVNQQMVTPAANVVSENLETPAYLRKGRAPLPEQPLETEWKKPVYKETPVSAKMMQLAEDFSKKKNPMSQIEGIDYMSRDAAGNLAQQVTEKKKLPITLEMQVGSIPTEAKREIVKYVSKHLEEKPEEIFKKGSGFIESIKGKIDVNKWFNDLTPEERDAFVKKIRGIKTEIKSDKLLTAKEISEKMFPSSAITQSELSNLRWQKDKSSLKDIRTK